MKEAIKNGENFDLESDNNILIRQDIDLTKEQAKEEPKEEATEEETPAALPEESESAPEETASEETESSEPEAEPETEHEAEASAFEAPVAPEVDEAAFVAPIDLGGLGADVASIGVPEESASYESSEIPAYEEPVAENSWNQESSFDSYEDPVVSSYDETQTEPAYEELGTVSNEYAEEFDNDFEKVATVVTSEADIDKLEEAFFENQKAVFASMRQIISVLLRIADESLNLYSDTKEKGYRTGADDRKHYELTKEFNGYKKKQEMFTEEETYTPVDTESSFTDEQNDNDNSGYGFFAA